MSDRDEAVEGLPYLPRMVVKSIESGALDAYLEVILSYAHDRKRFLRSVPGFRSK